MKYLKNKSVLITGAAGSIGAELSRHVVKYGPSKLILLDQWESGLFYLNEEMKSPNVFPVIGDIRNEKRISNILVKHAPDVVFHAAAYKHVPLMEDNISEAIETNIYATSNLCRMVSCERFIFISTDKAVEPVSVMGMTKAIAERIVQSQPKGKTEFITVRFGNVLGSSGSVMPIFKKQIENGGPVTVTDPKMTRYFMSLSEAVSLVIQAGAYGHNGDIFVLDMGKPVSVLELAKNMIAYAGNSQNIKIKIIGKRPGERLHEKLFWNKERQVKTEHPRLLKANGIKIKVDDLGFLSGEITKEMLVEYCKKYLPYG